MTRILFLAANPQGVSCRRLDEEIRTIEERIQLSAMRDLFEVRHQWAVRSSDLQRALLQHKPEIVHFAGLGTTAGEIILEDERGESRAVSAAAIGHLFSILGKDNVRCVVINACYSAIQARAIAPHVGCVVGMAEMVSAGAGVCFAAAFYQALGFGRTIRTAFELACNQLELEGHKANLSPVLLAPDVEAEDFVLANANRPTLLSASVLMRLGDGGANVRSETARQLGYLRDAAAIPILEARWPLEHDPTVRYWLAWALGWIGDSQGIRSLLRLKQAEDDQFAGAGIDEALGLTKRDS